MSVAGVEERGASDDLPSGAGSDLGEMIVLRVNERRSQALAAGGGAASRVAVGRQSSIQGGFGSPAQWDLGEACIRDAPALTV